MSTNRPLRAELRKLTSTRLPIAFLLVLVMIAAINATAVVFGTDMDGSKAFVSTAADQQSLIAFAGNAFIIAGLFGATAVAREYGHQTVIPTFLAEPQRGRACIAQYSAVAAAGAAIGLIGAALTSAAVVASLPTTDFGFLVATGDLLRVLAASAWAGAAGALLGGGFGGVVRNTGGAVTGTVLALVIAPPLIVQLASGAVSWIPATLANVLAGVGTEVSVGAAILALVAWAAVPAAAGVLVTVRRDIA